MIEPLWTIYLLLAVQPGFATGADHLGSPIFNWCKSPVPANLGWDNGELNYFGNAIRLMECASLIGDEQTNWPNGSRSIVGRTQWPVIGQSSQL